MFANVLLIKISETFHFGYRIGSRQRFQEDHHISTSREATAEAMD